MMMAIRDAARDAWVRARSDREHEARDALAIVLAPFDVAMLETVDVQAADAYTLFVFHDAEDDVYLATRTRGDGWDVHVVADEGGWTIQGKPVESLAHLHELLPTPELEEETYPAWESQLAVNAGERYTCDDGHVYEVVQSHQTQAGWEPPSVPALWKKVTT